MDKLADDIRVAARHRDSWYRHRRIDALAKEVRALEAERDGLRREVNAAFESMDPIAPCQINLAARVRQIVDERDRLAIELESQRRKKFRAQAERDELREALEVVTVRDHRGDIYLCGERHSSMLTSGPESNALAELSTLVPTPNQRARLRAALDPTTPAPSGAKESDDE